MIAAPKIRASAAAGSLSTRLCAGLLGLAALAALACPVAAAEAQRIVSIGGGTTEILYRLGVQDRVVAVDTTSLYPPEATQKPNVGYIRALSAEGVLALSPDLILMEEGGGPPEVVSLLDKAGVRIVHLPGGHSAKALPEKIRAIADAVGEKAEGARLADQMAVDLERLHRDLSTVAKRKRVLFVLSLVDGRPMAAGSDTAADAMIRLAGGENVFAEVHGYKTISPEAAAALQPDVVLMVSRGGGLDPKKDALKLPAFAETPAGKTGALVRMDALYLLGFGPRTAQAARELAEKLYPEQAAAWKAAQ